MADPDSTPGKSPAFQFYPNDFLSDANVIVMTLQERGAYITLLCLCWQQGGLPSDVEKLSRLCGTPAVTFRRLWPAIAPCFRTVADGTRLMNPRLEKERKKQRLFRKSQSDKGKLGGRPKKPELSSEKATGFENESRTLREVKAEKSSSSSVFDLRTSSSEKRENAPPARKPLSPSSDSTLTERAGAFIERYQALYTKHRKGAHYHHRPIDFQHALELCRTWQDDTRLDKIAGVFLTTDHKFAEEGSRTLGQLAAMASWCDGRLAEAGIA